MHQFRRRRDVPPRVRKERAVLPPAPPTPEEQAMAEAIERAREELGK